MESTAQKITTIKELIEKLKNKPTNSSYLEIMKSADIPEREMEKFYSWNDEHYTRNCLFKSNDFELLLICWEKGQQSPIHNFNAQEAWIHTIHGRLKEERFQLVNEKLEKVSSMLLGTSEFSYMTDPNAVHRYINDYESRTVSLNLYVRPVQTRKEYNPTTKEAEVKKVVYNKVF